METKAEIGPWGFDLAGMNRQVHPGSSFYEYANGGWLARQSIPADRAYWGTFAVLRVQSEQRVRSLIEAPEAAAANSSSVAQVSAFYRAYCAADAITAAGIAPLRPGLARIALARTHEQLAELLGEPELGVSGPVRLSVVLDDADPERYVVLVQQARLGLPDREHYLSSALAARRVRAEYVAHIACLQKLFGAAEPQADAAAILQLETQLARLQWPAAKRRQRALTYNPRSRAELAAESGSFPWPALLASAGLAGQERFVVAELDAVQRALALFREIPARTWRTYLAYRYVVEHAELLPAEVDQACFDFYGRALSGQGTLRSRESRAVDAVNLALGEAVGQLYVARHFPQSYKLQLLRLVEQLRATFDARLCELPWLTERTRQLAQQKLRRFVPKIGYPEVWQDYAGLAVRADDAFGNAVRARVWRWQRDLERLARPADRSRWSITPQTVNASYDPSWNEIVFPAGLLQPPFFDPYADAAVNYGAIGAVIGHEMGHGFDDQGAKSDARGVLCDWWQPQDARGFDALVERLVAQYDAYEPVPGARVNGRLTVGENIGDLGGLGLAHAAYRAALGGKPAPVLDGFTGDQRFFLGWAQIWRQLRREESLRTLLISDPHSPSALRVDGVVRNLDAFYAAFDVREGDPLWLAPEARVRIW